MKPKLLSSYLALLLLICVLNPGHALPTDPVKVATETTDPDTDQDKEKSPSKHNDDPQQAVESDAAVTKRLEVQPEEEQPSLASMSLNYIFYVIYKFKYADIFNFSKRHDAKDQLSLFGSMDTLNQFLQTVRLLR